MNSAIEVHAMSMEHLDALVEIAKESSENFWTKGIFTDHLNSRNHGGLVATVNNKIVGYAATQHRHKRSRVQIWDLVVLPDYRFKGVGRTLVQPMLDTVPSDLEGIEFNVRESNLPAQLFLQKMKFWCEAIALGYFIDKVGGPPLVEDAYCFVYNPRKERKKDEQIRIIDRVGTFVAKSRMCPSPA